MAFAVMIGRVNVVSNMYDIVDVADEDGKNEAYDNVGNNLECKSDDEISSIRNGLFVENDDSSVTEWVEGKSAGDEKLLEIIFEDTDLSDLDGFSVDSDKDEICLLVTIAFLFWHLMHQVVQAVFVFSVFLHLPNFIGLISCS